MGWLAASVLAVIVATLGVKIWLLHRGVKALRLDLAQKLDRDTPIPYYPCHAGTGSCGGWRQPSTRSCGCCGRSACATSRATGM